MAKQNKPDIKKYDQILGCMKWYVDENNPDSVLAEYKRNGYYELRSIYDRRFEAFVKNEYCNLTQQENTEGYSSKLAKYEREALLADNRITVYTRLAGSADDTAYFLGDDKNIIIYTNKDGYVAKKRYPKYKFTKKTSTVAQIMPKKSQAENLLKLLKPFLNMSEDMQIIFVVNLVQQFLCNSSHFLSVISAPKGTGKSTMMKWWRKIIDPSKAEVALMPSSPDELKNHLSNHQFVAFDNTEPLNKMYADIICAAVTGVTVIKRQLYTDCAEIIQRLHNTVLLNGIDIIPRRSDLLDRAILFKLDKLEHKDRKSETEIHESFDKVLPYVLGSIFDTLVEYFKIKDTTEVTGKHRMSGAYKDCYIIATVLGIADKFEEAFEKNQQELQQGFAESDSLISAIYSYFNDKGTNKIEGTARSVYEALRIYTNEPNFPKSDSAFTRSLNQQKDELQQSRLNFMRIKEHDATRVIIQKI